MECTILTLSGTNLPSGSSAVSINSDTIFYAWREIHVTSCYTLEFSNPTQPCSKCRNRHPFGVQLGVLRYVPAQLIYFSDIYRRHQGCYPTRTSPCPSWGSGSLILKEKGPKCCTPALICKQGKPPLAYTCSMSGYRGIRWAEIPLASICKCRRGNSQNIPHFCACRLGALRGIPLQGIQAWWGELLQASSPGLAHCVLTQGTAVW